MFNLIHALAPFVELTIRFCIIDFLLFIAIVMETSTKIQLLKFTQVFRLCCNDLYSQLTLFHLSILSILYFILNLTID